MTLDYTSLALQLFASVVTLWGIWEMGNKRLRGPALALVSDLAFLVLDIYAHLWGLLPFCAVLFVFHIRNLIKWRRDASREAARSA